MVKKNIFSNQIFLYSCAFIFFAGDMSVLFSCGKQIVYLVWAFYSVLLFYKRRPFLLLPLLLLFLILESFIALGWWGISLSYILPLTLASYRLRYFMYNSVLLPQAVFTIGLLVQTIAIERLFIGALSGWRYTVGKIAVNMIIGFFISLFFRNQGKQDNRL